MSFDGTLLHHLIDELKSELITGRINKIYQLSSYDLLFVINTKKGKQQLLVSASPRYSRMHLTTMTYEKPDYPPTFCMLLRKHLDGGIIEDIEQIGNDRVCIFTVRTRNELGDQVHKKLIVEPMNKHANIIVTDNDDKIIDAIKKVMPFDGNERTVFPGAIYQQPVSSKHNPFDDKERSLFSEDNVSEQSIMAYFDGVSPVLAKEITHRYHQGITAIEEIVKSVITSKNPHITISKKEIVYFTTLMHLKGEVISFASVNQAIDRFYYQKDQKDIIKQQSGNIMKLVKNYINRITKKISKLETQLTDTSKMDKFRIYGEIIQANLTSMKKGNNQVTLYNYYEGKTVTIPLDEKLTPIANSKKYFKKYKKLKTSIPYVEEQIKQAKDELEYFDNLLTQVEHASLKDIVEIKEELITLGYSKQKKTSNKKKKPQFETYVDAEGVDIIVGKNNLQNEYITHKLAKHTDVWFHTKGPGAHVIVRKPLPLSETTIRTAAQLASYFSKARQSSSVAVDYVPVRHVKKIPGKVGSFVRYKHHKTIYIDPDEDFILSLTKK